MITVVVFDFVSLEGGRSGLEEWPIAGSEVARIGVISLIVGLFIIPWGISDALLMGWVPLSPEGGRIGPKGSASSWLSSSGTKVDDLEAGTKVDDDAERDPVEDEDGFCSLRRKGGAFLVGKRRGKSSSSSESESESERTIVSMAATFSEDILIGSLDTLPKDLIDVWVDVDEGAVVCLTA